MRRYAALVFSVSALGLFGTAIAQPAGGSDAKGNAPLKRTHTIDDGAPKPGANSFTEGQARRHMLNSGYSSVSALTKGRDGVWRGTAMKGSTPVDVALDFKGNVTEAAAPPPATTTLAKTTLAASTLGASSPPARAAQTATSSTTTTASTTMAVVHHHRAHHHRQHHHGAGAGVPGRNGVGMSGVDRNHNGVSDKEDRAHDAVVH